MKTKPMSPPTNKKWQRTLHEIIFEADTTAGRLFDIALLWAIVLSLLVVSLESVIEIKLEYGGLLRGIEWFFTILFTLEYVARIISLQKPLKYVFSFFGIVDLLSIVPTYLSLFIAGPQYLVVIRTLRLLRVFRVLKLARYLSGLRVLTIAMRQSRPKIIVFLVGVTSLAVIMGTLMYLVEGPENGFTSIPRSVYWAIVTLTTVGYGDITPASPLGQAIAACIMIMGYAIIAVPTGIMAAEITQVREGEVSTQSCPQCSLEGHDYEAKFCKKCENKLKKQV